MNTFNEITIDELSTVDGGGLIGAGVGAVGGGIVGLIVGVGHAVYSGDINKINQDVTYGGAIGAIGGAFSPL